MRASPGLDDAQLLAAVHKAERIRVASRERTGRLLAVAPDLAGDRNAGFPGPWWIAGGFAIELATGRAIRPHDDIDVGLLRSDHLGH